MEKHEALELLAELDGDEHEWVDFKQDYYIGGIGPKTAEFIRDIASFANTISPRTERYIFIGVDDDGNIVGVGADSTKKHQNRPRHVFSYDESDIQEIADSNLEPCPSFSFHQYQHNGVEFGALVVYPVLQAPCVTFQDINDADGNRILHRGLVFIRKGSRKKVAGHEEIEEIIQKRIKRRREDILENVGKIVSLGPDTIDQLGTQVTDDGIAVTPSEDSGIEVQERLTREPASTLDEELNGDIANWTSRGDLLSQKATWTYYSNPTELRLDNEAVQFLTLGALENGVRGMFWLKEIKNSDFEDILSEVPNKTHTVERTASIFVLMGDSMGLNRFLDTTSVTAKYGKLSEYPNVVSKPLGERVDHVIESRNHELEYGGWSTEFDVLELSEDEIENQIKDISETLTYIYEDAEENRSLLWKTGVFRDSIADLESSLARFVSSNGE